MSVSSASGDSQSDGGSRDETFVAVRGGAGGVASLIRASKQQAGGLKSLDKISREARMERSLSTHESAVFGGEDSAPPKPSRHTRRLLSVPNFAPNQSNGDISRKVLPSPTSTNQKHKGDNTPPPPKPPRTGSTSPGDFLTMHTEHELVAAFEECEGLEEYEYEEEEGEDEVLVDDEGQMEGEGELAEEEEVQMEEGEEAEWEEQGPEQRNSSQSSNGSATGYQVNLPEDRHPQNAPAASSTAKQPLLPTTKLRSVGSDCSPSLSPASLRMERSLSQEPNSDHTPSSSPANLKRGPSKSSSEEPSASPTMDASKSAKNRSPKIPMMPPSNKAQTPPTPPRTTPPSKKSPKYFPPKPLPHATNHSREASLDKGEEEVRAESVRLKMAEEENEKLRRQLKMLKEQLKVSASDEQPLLSDPLAAEDREFRTRSRSVSPGEDEERDKFPSGESRPMVAKPVPVPRTRAQTTIGSSPKRKSDMTVLTPSSLPATVGFATPGGATGTKDHETARSKIPMIPKVGSNSPVPKPRRLTSATSESETANHVGDTSWMKSAASTERTPPAKVGERNTAKPASPVTKVRSEVKQSTKDDDSEEKKRAIKTLSKLLPSSNKPPPLLPPVKPPTPQTGPLSHASTVGSNVKTPQSASPKTVSPVPIQSHSSKAIPVPRQVSTTPTTQSWVPRRTSETDNDSKSGVSESSLTKPNNVSSPLSSSVPPPAPSEPSKPKSIVKAPLNSAAIPVPRTAGKAKYKKVTLTDDSWIKRKESLSNESSDSAPTTPRDPKPVSSVPAPASVRVSSTTGSDSSAATPQRTDTGSTSSVSSANKPANASPMPFRNHPIMPGPKPVQQSFIPPSEPASGKVTPTKVTDPPPKAKAENPSPVKRRFWGKTPSDGEKVSRRHSFTRTNSNDDTMTPLQNEVKGKKKWGRNKGLANSQLVGERGGKTGNFRPVSMMVETESKPEFTASAVTSMPRGLKPEDALPKESKKGFLGRFKNKTTIQKTAPDKPQEESDSSDDEQGGTIKRMPKLRHVSTVDKHQVEDDSEPQYPQLFEYVFGVSLEDNGSGKLSTKLTYTFPPTSREFTGKDEALKSIPQFCFPDIDQWKPTKNYKSESYSFVLTDMEGNRRYGYCRRLLPAGTGPRLPEVFCIVSPLGCFSLYEDILNQVEERRAVSTLAVFNFLKAISANPFPRPGRSVEVKVFGARGSGMEAVTFKRPLDSRLEHVDFSLLFSTLSQRKIIQLFSSLLMERRVIFCATSLSLTTGCAHALMALLYPFEWQHVFIPVLPSSLIDFVCSPLPYIIGIHPVSCKLFDTMDTMEEAVIINLDKGKFMRKIGDETSILPRKLFEFLEGKLNSSTITTEYSRKSKSQGNSKADDIVVNTFMTFFAYLYGDYSTALKDVKGGKEFQRDEYITRFTSKSTKRFLEAFHMTQMFEHFIEQRENPSKAETLAASLFEKRLPELKERCQDIEIFSGKSRFDRWKMKKDLAKD